MFRMDSNDSIYDIEALRQGDSGAARCHVRARRDDRSDTGRLRARYHGVEIVCKLLVVEVAVRINQHGMQA